MTNQITPLPEAIDSALVSGDLSKLTTEQRINFYQRVCSSLGLNPLTRPFDYITLNGKLTLYARKDAADQIRKVNGVSIDKPEITFEDDWIIVTVGAHTNDGRTDSDVGVVNKKDMRGDFGNALMKAVTKAKRRVTLSICGLGMLDETEVETIPGAVVTPAVIEATVTEVKPSATMSLEMAGSIKSSDGTPYIELTSEDLANRSIGIGKKLAKNHLTQEERDDYQQRMDAIATILASRKVNA